MDLETLKIISSIIGMIGGVLGFFVFIDNYILKFKPTFNISNRLFFRYKLEEKHTIIKRKTLDSIVLKIEVFNKRNKVGSIDDFAIRIYDSRSTSPSTYMLYAENIIDKLPSKTFELDNIESSSFSPVSILGKSKSSFVIEFKPEKYTGMILDPEGSIKLDFLYYRKVKGWKSIGTFTPYYFKSHNEQENINGVIEYSLLDTAVTRKDALSSLQAPKVGIYKGISGKYMGYYVMKPIYLLKRIITYPVKLFELIYAGAQLIVRYVYNQYLILPLITIKSKTLPRISFRPAKTHLSEATNQSIKICKKHIERLSKDINDKADQNAKIVIVDDTNGFKVKRGKLEIKFYKSGDGYIQVNDTGSYPQMFTFRMELIEYPFGIRLWKINNKIMSVKSACIHVMDSFILLAH